METEGLLDYQGMVGIISIVRWNLRPVIFGVDQSPRILTENSVEFPCDLASAMGGAPTFKIVVVRSKCGTWGGVV